MINDIIALCSRPEEACNFIQDAVKQDYFKYDFDLGDAEITIDTDADDFLRDRFAVPILFRFLPQALTDAFFTRRQLVEVAGSAKSRNTDYIHILDTAAFYQGKYETALEFVVKNGYNEIPCYMLLYISGESNPSSVFVVKPQTVLDFISAQKKRIV